MFVKAFRRLIAPYLGVIKKHLGYCVKTTFETVSKNLTSDLAEFSYNRYGVLVSVEYTLPSGTITKTLNYQSGKLTSVVLSGDTPNGITLTKAINYDASGRLARASYS